MHFPLLDVKEKLIEAIYTPLPTSVYRFCLKTTFLFLYFFFSSHISQSETCQRFYLKSVLEFARKTPYYGRQGNRSEALNIRHNLPGEGEREGNKRALAKFGLPDIHRKPLFPVRL